MFDSTAVGLPMMLFSLLGLLVAVPTALYAFAHRRAHVLRKVGMAIGLWCGIYVILLLLASFTSGERSLPLGARMDFCGFYLDCHLGVRVSDVRSAKLITTSRGTFTAEHTFHVVDLTYDSDALHAALHLRRPPSVIALWGAVQIEPDREVTAAVRQSSGQRPVPVGVLLPRTGKIPATYVFDVPTPTNELRLDVRTGNRFDRFLELFLIGDADSFLHAETYLGLW